MRILFTSVLLLSLFSCRFFRSKEIKPEVNIDAVAEMNKDFASLKKYFTKDSLTGEINVEQFIPDSVVNKFLSEKTDSNAKTHPVTYLTNNFGRFFLVQLPCDSEIYCAVYRLLEFKPDGNFVRDTKVGMDLGAEGWSNLFQILLVYDTVLVTYQDKYNEATDRHAPHEEHRFSLTLQ